MKKKEVDIFFQKLSKEWKHPTEIILIGGAAALLYGGGRPTLDVDFQFKFKGKSSFDEFSEAIAKVVKDTGIEAQFSEEVDRWSAISFLDFDKHGILYKKFEKLEVFLPEPSYWSIGKIGRYLNSDCEDLIMVFRKNSVDPVKLAHLWRKALEKSPRSEQIPIIKKYMIDFFKHYGSKIWGSQFDLESIICLL